MTFGAQVDIYCQKVESYGLLEENDTILAFGEYMCQNLHYRLGIRGHAPPNLRPCRTYGMASIRSGNSAGASSPAMMLVIGFWILMRKNEWRHTWLQQRHVISW